MIGRIYWLLLNAAIFIAIDVPHYARRITTRSHARPLHRHHSPWDPLRSVGGQGQPAASVRQPWRDNGKDRSAEGKPERN